MNREVKQKWLNALRSGEYIQGKSKLKDGNTFCCLGVLTDLYIKEHKNCYWKDDPFIDGEIEENNVLCAKVKKWAGLSGSNPIIKNKGMCIAQLNDEGYSFSKIADLIEAEL